MSIAPTSVINTPQLRTTISATGPSSVSPKVDRRRNRGIHHGAGEGTRHEHDPFDVVCDVDKTSKQVLINFAAGSFRFISSSKDPTGYELKTPTATLGIRGTVFDFYVAEKGRMVVLMHKGAVDVCSAGCKLHNKLGRLAYVTASGKVVLRKYWDPKLLPGVSIKEAFPFLGKKLAFDNVIRYASLMAPAIKAAARGRQAANAATVAPAVAFNMDGTITFAGMSAASAGQLSGLGPGVGGPGQGVGG